MPIPVGNKSWDQICNEFGLNPDTAVWPNHFFGKGGAPGARPLSFSDFDGRSAGVTFDQTPGGYSINTEFTGGGFSVNASTAVTWTYTADGTVSPSAANGSVSSSISFSCGANNSGSVSLTATYGGNTFNWNITFSPTP